MVGISTAESVVMAALWERGPLGVDEIVAAVGGPQSWERSTVRTLINRLLKKKAVVSEKADGRVRYRPLVSRADYVTEESQGLLDRLFGGELAPLVQHFAQHRRPSPEELARLKRMIAELEADDE